MSKSLTLSTGYEMPTVGLGTWQAVDEEVEAAVTAALECGYRHIDTAFFYGNEEAIGRSIRKWIDDGGDREDLFITTKLPPYANRASDVEEYVNYSLENMGLDYIDMYLIHTPFTFIKDENCYAPATEEDGTIVLDLEADHLSTWKAMEAQVENGKLRSIGISNFNEAQILNLVENADIQPSNLQMEIYAYNQQRPLRELCQKHGIVVTAYSSLGSPGTMPAIKSEKSSIVTNLLEHPLVQSVAEAHGKSCAQVLLRHQLQADVVVIPKSINPDRIAENFDIFDFELTEDEMQQLDELDMGDEGRLFHFPNLFPGVENHPAYPF